ncbi:entry exclusion protein TrbK [Agrobacterium tumefaciens]|uniref:Entry exclusion protein TrbK n=1 Tax=Agrobacterium tumefaciens TaxID=358 RepID=A0A2Z2PPY5_AGRTU|nr:entry exclusion protein TrbK [Agrobacterium tumefaciens]ASK44420.1 entry exclusion protein TrbK [Agrobacterium tumefaciens]NSY46764.1 entry exclusion protein TrbK [Agrobacterium tumefaciens]
MSPRILIALAVAGLVAIAGGMILWVIVQPGATTPAPAAASGSGEARREQRERFFGGDPDRDVRGGQEMKPRW